MDISEYNIQFVFKASAWHAYVKNGIFKSDSFGYARATNIMSTKSETDFEWSVKLFGGPDFSVGIASKFRPFLSTVNTLNCNLIYTYDQNAIMYSSYNADIRVGENSIHANLMEHQSEDVIKFRFQPRTKKLLIDRTRNSRTNGQYEVDLNDDVNYYPFVQTSHHSAREAHLIP